MSNQTLNQLAGRRRHFLDCLVEGGLVCPGRNRESTEFADKLQGCVADFQFGRGRLEVEEGLDAAAHGRDVFAMPKADKPELDGLRREGATPTQTVGTYLNL